MDVKFESWKDIIKDENIVFKKTKVLTDNVLSYCPGCGHGVAHRLIAETIEEMGIQDQTIGIAPVGCSVLAYEFFDIDMQQAAHGRATALATAIKRLYPNKFVFTYQGDGDLAAIGGNETMHACNRGENIVVIFINNGIYGMTGGQMAPTTLDGMVTATSPYGRDPQMMGHPLHITELVAMLPGTYYVTRQSVHKPANVRKAKKAIKEAFQCQIDRKGFSIVEVLSTCPTNWGMTPIDALKWLNDNLIPYYPIGNFRRPGEDK